MNRITHRTVGRSRQVTVSLLGALMLLATTAFVPTEAVAEIALTKHNLGSGGTGTNKFSGTSEICVFCHTPHGGDTSAAVPLWNRNLALPSTYTTYDSLGTSTLDGKVLPVGSVSIACLSCHDGAQAMNSVINAPGSGFAGDSTWTGGGWTGSHQSAGLMTGDAKLGTDLKDDHPIGIQYCGGGITVATPGGVCKDPDFKAPANAPIGGSTVFWVETTGSVAGRDKTDMILYNRTGTFTVASGGGTTTGAEPFVECASCHDPHSSVNPTFLRTTNESSKVCLTCHVK
jgi:predicted CXXCH cytochrome family protein